MSTTLDLSAAPATPKPRCTDAAWCIGHAIPGDPVHLSALTDAHGMPLWLKRVGDGETVVVRGRAGRVLQWSPAQAREVAGELLKLYAAARADNYRRGIPTDTGSEGPR